MSEYLFSVPQRFATEEHPLGAGPDDLLVVEAEDQDQAVGIANSVMTATGWHQCLHPDLPDRDRIVAEHYPGRRIPCRIPQFIVFEVTETTTWRVSVASSELNGYFGDDWPGRIDVPDLWPQMGNDTDGFGWQLFSHVRAADESDRSAAVVDAAIELERIRVVGTTFPRSEALVIDEGQL
jgi:hypothetical protein